MKHIAAYMMLKVSGQEATAESVTAVVTAAGGSVDDASLAALSADLAGTDFDELLAGGVEKLKNVKMGGGGGGGGAAAPAAGGAAKAAVKEEAPKEEEMDLSGGMDMFGGAAAGGGDY